MINHTDAFETKWLAGKLKEKWLSHGTTRTQWLSDIGFSGRKTNGAVHVSYLFSAKRGLSFVKAVRLATMAGVDLSELQKQIIKLEGLRDYFSKADGS